MVGPLSEYMKELVVGSLVRGYLRYVIEEYETYPEIRELRVPRTGETALHVAISNESERLAARMILAAGRDTLAICNKNGDTALHLAAKSGNAYLCKLIARKHGALVGARNDSGETPFFPALTHGRTEAFLYLHYFCKRNAGREEYGRYTTKNGDTILHCAISEEHFDIAYTIIREYRELILKENNDGLSALHLLATKPSVFPSGVHLSGLRKLVYSCIRVSRPDRLNPTTTIIDPPHPREKKKWTDSWSKSTDDDNKDSDYCEFKTINARGHEKVDQQDEAAAAAKNEQVGHSEIGQQDEEAANMEQVVHVEIDQQEAAKKKVKFDAKEWCRGCIWFILMLLFVVLPYAVDCAIRQLIRLPTKLAKCISGFEEYVRLKERSTWSAEVMDELIRCHYRYEIEREMGICDQPPIEEEDNKKMKEICVCLAEGTSKDIPYNSKHAEEPRTKQKVESPLFIAAKNGISEMVFEILDVNPGAAHDVNAENKTIVMLAVEHRHPRLYQDLITYLNSTKTIFGQVDTDGNSLLHIAAKFKDGQQFWRIRGAAFHMQMEIKWYKFIEKSMSPRFFARYNKAHITADEIFQESHKLLIDESRNWLTSTSQSCSVVAALIATVAFATSATVPGGLKQDNGVPSLEHKPVFIISSGSSLVALSSSMISVVMFLGILTSNFKLEDFRDDLPYKLLLGLLSLLISIVSMVISFFAGHYFVLKQELNHNTTLVYACMCTPLLAFIMAKFPLSFEMVWTTLRTKPHN